MSQYLRKVLNDIPPYVPGRSIEWVQKKYGLFKVYKLASNENPLGPSPVAVKAVRQSLKKLNYYPDPAGISLKSKLSDRTGLAPDNFLLGNGATELIDIAAMAFIEPGNEVIMSSPSFPKYYLSAGRLMAEIVTVPMTCFRHDYKQIMNSITGKTKVIFIDTPNNPVGTRLLKSEQEYIIDHLPGHVVLVIDEAYREFVPQEDCLEYASVLRKNKNIVFLRTFSKSYGLSGLRIGYAVGHPEIIVDMNRVREVFNVNALALVAAEAALDDEGHLRRTLEANSSGFRYLSRHLNRMGYEFQLSYANFILINTNRKPEDADEFLLKNGIIVRPVRLPNIAGSYIRVSIGKPGENRAFIAVMEKMLTALPEIDAVQI